MAERKGLEPSASGVTGRRYNRLNYRSAEAAFPNRFGRLTTREGLPNMDIGKIRYRLKWRSGRDSNPRPPA